MRRPTRPKIKKGKPLKVRVVSKSPKKEEAQTGFSLPVDTKTRARARYRKAKKRALREKFRKTTISLMRGEKSGRFGKK